MSTRDLPHSFSELSYGWVKRIRAEFTVGKSKEQLLAEDYHSTTDEDSEVVTSVKANSLWPAFASGAGLFSDGYVNNSISTVLFCLKKIYPDEITKSNAINNIASIAFVGTVVGQLGFGYISDRIACLTVWRFFLGVAIGAEYPTSSVIASEFANQLPPGKRNRYFSWFTNAMIDLGFVVSAFVPLVLLWIFTEKHLRALWRVAIGLGVIPPLSLFFMRLKMKNSSSFQKLHMKNVKYRDYPWWLIVKFYWFRLTIVSLIWFIYDFSAYSFGNFNTIIIGEIIPETPIWKQWGWSIVFNLFYIPGAFLGAISADYIGPRLTLALGVGIQGVVGIAMSACLNSLKKHIAGFVVVFGIFTTFGEFGPGDNIGFKDICYSH